MEFEWDEAKARLNERKHGLAFSDATRIFAGPVVEVIDDRFDCGELRFNSLGLLDETVVLSVAHTDRDGVTRLISARHASRAERDFYWRMVEDGD